MININLSKFKSLDQALKYYKQKRNKIGIDGKYLSRLFNKTKLKVVYNTEPYQAKGNEVATCGRHVIFRILNSDLDLKKYHKF